MSLLLIAALSLGAIGRSDRSAPGDRQTAPPTAEQPRLSLDALLDAFTAGHPELIESQLRTRADFDRIRVDLFRAFERWQGAWQPSHAAFGLTIAFVAIEQGWPNAMGFLEAARDVVTSRPDPPGRDASADEFERLFHRTAVAYLAGVPMPVEAESYLDSVSARITTGVRSRARAQIDDPRLLFARALARETRTLPAAGAPTETPRTWIVPARDRNRRAELQSIGVLFEQAARDPAVSAEAAVRRAFLQYRIGAPGAALALLDRTGSTGDPIVDYWGALIRGRALNALGRREDAVRAYEGALVLAPGAQTPAIALATLYLRVGQRDRAVELAERALVQRRSAPDPWGQYWLGERRQFPAWLKQLQDARP